MVNCDFRGGRKVGLMSSWIGRLFNSRCRKRAIAKLGNILLPLSNSVEQTAPSARIRSHSCSYFPFRVRR